MSKRKPAAPVFKPYPFGQMALLPRQYDEFIPAEHLVRVVNDVIEKLDLRVLEAQYKGGGTSSYHPRMLLKVLVYAYSQKIYASRRIGKALQEQLPFLWLSGGQQPDFRTLNAFRSSRMKGVIDEVFASVLEYLVETGHVKLARYFVDGTKIEADANKHKVVWRKRKETYENRLRPQIQELLQEIEQVNAAEQTAYGEQDLEEKGAEALAPELTAEALKTKIAALNARLQTLAPTEPSAGPAAEATASPTPETLRAAQQALKKLEKDCLPRLEKYEQQTETLAGRNSYAKTDPDASCMRMKEDRGAEKPWPKPAYNVQIGTEGQFIVGFSVHGNAGDPTCLIPHLEQVERNLGRLPKTIVADAAYGSEENYAYVDQHHLGNFLKYNTFYQDTHHYRDPEVLRAHQFRAEHFGYDPATDQFICPAEKRLAFTYESQYTTSNEYVTRRRHYACADCSACPLKPQCTRAKGNREIRISHKLLAYRKQARENLTSEEGQALRAARSTEVETVFGHLKHNQGFRRFHLRGLKKVKTEWGLVSIAHNMQKLAGG
jgi:transposase